MNQSGKSDPPESGARRQKAQRDMRSLSRLSELAYSELLDALTTSRFHWSGDIPSLMYFSGAKQDWVLIASGADTGIPNQRKMWEVYFKRHSKTKEEFLAD